jgi:uncharacterized Zn finger protein
MNDPAFASVERYRTAWQAHGVAVLAADKRKPSRSEKAGLDAADRELSAAEYELTVTTPRTKEVIHAKLEQLGRFDDVELIKDAIASILRSPHWL